MEKSPTTTFGFLHNCLFWSTTSQLVCGLVFIWDSNGIIQFTSVRKSFSRNNHIAMPPFGLQRRRSKSPDKFRRKTNSYERRPSIASASSATEAFLQNVNQQDSGSSQYSQHEINGQRKALPDLRKGKHTTPQPVIQGNAFRNSNLARLEQTAVSARRDETIDIIIDQSTSIDSS